MVADLKPDQSKARQSLASAAELQSSKLRKWTWGVVNNWVWGWFVTQHICRDKWLIFMQRWNAEASEWDTTGSHALIHVGGFPTDKRIFILAMDHCSYCRKNKGSPSGQHRPEPWKIWANPDPTVLWEHGTARWRARCQALELSSNSSNTCWAPATCKTLCGHLKVFVLSLLLQNTMCIPALGPLLLLLSLPAMIFAGIVTWLPCHHSSLSLNLTFTERLFWSPAKVATACPDSFTSASSQFIFMALTTTWHVVCLFVCW